jgi:hypothetical protein
MDLNEFVNHGIQNKDWQGLIAFRFRVLNYLIKEYEMSDILTKTVDCHLSKEIDNRMRVEYNAANNVPNTAKVFVDYFRAIFDRGENQ